jgi:hypothetical protein
MQDDAAYIVSAEHECRGKLNQFACRLSDSDAYVVVNVTSMCMEVKSKSCPQMLLRQSTTVCSCSTHISCIRDYPSAGDRWSAIKSQICILESFRVLFATAVVSTPNGRTQKGSIPPSGSAVVSPQANLRLQPPAALDSIARVALDCVFVKMTRMG